MGCRRLDFIFRGKKEELEIHVHFLSSLTQLFAFQESQDFLLHSSFSAYLHIFEDDLFPRYYIQILHIYQGKLSQFCTS